MQKQRYFKNEGYSRKSNKHFEGAFTQGNGYINARASFEEDLLEEKQNARYWRLPANVTLEQIKNPISKWGIYIPGIYGCHPILGEEIVNLPYFLGINLYCGAEKFDMGVSNYAEYERSLDIETGILKRKLIWKTKKGIIKLYWMRYLSMQNTHISIQEVQLEVEQSISITIESFIDAGVTTNGYCHFTNIEAQQQDGIELYVELDSKQQVGMKTKCKVEGMPSVEWRVEQTSEKISEKANLMLVPGKKCKLIKTGMISTSIDTGNHIDVRKSLESLEKDICRCPIDIEEHEKYWKQLWERSDVQIEGDTKLEECLRFNIYHLLRAGNQSNNVAIDAKGYAGEAYFGHYFWDTEIYLLPFFIYTQPEQAKKLVEFRYNTLKGAKENAKRYGYKGARYPWEACITGKEQCSNWQYADLEVHITADVVYGLWMYYHITKDTEFLLHQGVEIMVETARYWIDRVEEKEDGCHLKGVMGPDEYLPFTNDNAYTNYLVRFSLEKTLEVIAMASDEKLEQLGVTQEECKNFDKVRRNLVFLEDPRKKFIWQCEKFEEYEDIDFNRMWQDRSKAFGNVISQEKNYRSKALKQADVVALLYLFPQNFDQETKKNCIEYYEKMTTHDSSLSKIIHSLVYGEIGEIDKSYQYASKSMMLDWGNDGAAEGIHIANAGGLWQGVVHGFGGLKGIDEQGKLRIQPRLPNHITKITYTVAARGVWYNVIVRKDRVEVEKRN